MSAVFAALAADAASWLYSCLRSDMNLSFSSLRSRGSVLAPWRTKISLSKYTTCGQGSIFTATTPLHRLLIDIRLCIVSGVFAQVEGVVDEILQIVGHIVEGSHGPAVFAVSLRHVHAVEFEVFLQTSLVVVGVVHADIERAACGVEESGDDMHYLMLLLCRVGHG